MIREIVIPTENSYTLLLPDEFIGKKVEVIAFELEESISTELLDDQHSMLEVEDRLQRIQSALKGYTFNSGGYKFDRDEANDYD